MDDPQVRSEDRNPQMPELQVQRRRRRRSRPKGINRLVRRTRDWLPLLVLVGLAAVAGGVVRVVEIGSGGGGGGAEKVIQASAVVKSLQGNADDRGAVAADPQEALAEAVKEDAIALLKLDVDTEEQLLGFKSGENPLDQILDWQLIEDVRKKTELDNSKFVVEDTRKLVAN